MQSLLDMGLNYWCDWFLE